MTAIQSPSTNPLDLSSLGTATRLLGPDEHSIEGIGKLSLQLLDGWLRVTMTHPKDTDVSELLGWDNGAREVDATTEALEVLTEHLGILPAEFTSGPADTLVIADGRLTFTHHEHLGADTAVDFEDLKAWAGDFAAITDPRVRHDLAVEIVELYESI
ncbi:hypothetical protein [Arthrobacter sp. IK3]|uniref:hypothetical protein n=1 Tax=Arthrobacter sp. IK3 TaxID=3448169 RepID=UPI003EE3A35C